MGSARMRRIESDGSRSCWPRRVGQEARLAYARPRAHGKPQPSGLLVDFSGDAGHRHGRTGCGDRVDRSAARRWVPPTDVGSGQGLRHPRVCEQACVNPERDATRLNQNTSGRRSAIDGRTTRHAGYAISQRIRKRVEEIFGWIKTTGGFRRTRYVGLDKTQMAGYLVASAYNLIRMVPLAGSRRASLTAATRRTTSRSAPVPRRDGSRTSRPSISPTIPLAPSPQALLPRPASGQSQAAMGGGTGAWDEACQAPPRLISTPNAARAPAEQGNFRLAGEARATVRVVDAAA